LLEAIELAIVVVVEWLLLLMWLTGVVDCDGGRTATGVITPPVPGDGSDALSAE
jgi:hypothetical protein